MDREDRSLPSLPVDGPVPRADLLLLEQIRDGDPDAGHRFIQEYYPGVYRYLLYLTGRRDAAEDLTQESFLQAWRRLDSFEGRSSLRTWLHRIAHREFLQALRSRRRAGGSRGAGGPDSGTERVMISLEEAGEPPQPHATAPMEGIELRAIIGKLPLEQREMVMLHYLDGYEYEEMAQILGIPVGRVKHRLSEARARLQQELAEGDLLYLNEPSIPMRQWAWLPLDQMHALETRLAGDRAGNRGAPGPEATTEEIMERREFLRQAATGAAGLMLSESEKEVVDHRLTQKVTCAFKGAALSDLCQKLQTDTGIPVAAGPSVADEKVTLFCEKLPLREVMRQLSRPFGYTWLRSGAPGQYRYELAQDLRSQLLEEELRNRDRNEALLALEQEIEKHRPYLSLTPDEIRARAKTAPPAEKKLLENLGGGDDPRSGLGYAPIQMYFRLSPREMEAIRAGQWLAFSADPQPDDAPLPRLPDAEFVPGERPLPPDVARGILQIWRWERIAPVPGGLGQVGADDPNGIPFASFPGLRPWLTLTIDASEPGRYVLLGNCGFRGPSNYLRGEIKEIGAGRSPKVLQPENETVNTRFAKDPDLRTLISIQPQPSCRPRLAPDASSESLPEPKVTTADALEALHRATGLPLIADFYTRLYPVETLTVRDMPRFTALNRLADAMRFRWNKDGHWLQFRSTSFYDDRRKEVPNRLLTRWAEARRRHGYLTLEELVEIAQLPDAPLKGEEMAEGARLCLGLAEWDLARNQPVLANLRFLAQFTPAQRQVMVTTAGLPFTRMTLAQQQGFLDRLLGSRAVGVEQGVGLQSLEELARATLRVDYRRPGWYEWQPAGGLLCLRWIVPLAPPPAGRWLLVPVVRERTREAALQSLRRVDPWIREAVWKAAVRYNPRLEPSAASEEAQIVPTKLDLTTLYTPGTLTRFSVQFQATDCQSNAGSW